MLLNELIDNAADTKKWMVKHIHHSRSKDYQNSYKKMAYDNEAEMTAVLGSIDDNVFIEQQKEELNDFLKNIARVKESLGLLVEA
jgi:23S rRNA maturation mini-RNase III